MAAPRQVNDHDFADKQLGKVARYGIYDVAVNTGWVKVGVDHETAAFAGGVYPPLAEGCRGKRLPGYPPAADPHLDERQWRLTLEAQARAPGPAGSAGWPL